MARLSWDNAGEKLFETGLDRGVLYLYDGTGVCWNGLTDFNEGDVIGLDSYVYDGLKTGYVSTPNGFAGSLSAYTYPEEFLSYIGISTNEDISGLQIPNQLGRKTFGLSYRTLVGDDVEGTDLGYKIHILYNLTAVADGIDYETLSDDIEAVEFSWSVLSTPEHLEGFKPTGHVIIDSRYLSEVRLAHLEDILYGTASAGPRLPALSDLLASVTDTYLVTITDNGDGSWTAEGPDNLVSMTDETTFSITSSGASVLDPDTYEITSA